MNGGSNRKSVPELEEILEKKIDVLDKGFIRIIDYMGCDDAIVQAARVSYGKGTKTVSQDKNLISYLMRNHHTTPFEMCEIKFHIKLPIFVARQWVRHRTANINEYSGRYSVMEDEFYIPQKEDIGFQSKNITQGREGSLDDSDAQCFIEKLDSNTKLCYESYNQFLKADISREISRITLPINNYTQWYWKIDLHNLLHFINLRADDHAQFEIQEYAKKIEDIIKKWVPYTYEAFLQYKKNSFTFSNNGLNFIRSKMRGKTISQDESGMSKREYNEVIKILEE